eukprot:CFRG1239T1
MNVIETEGANTPSHVALKSCLEKSMRITISDGRVITADRFICTDKDLNIVLNDAVELRTIRRPLPENPDEIEVVEESRKVGSVMVPGSHIVRIEVADEDAIAALAGANTVNST